MTGSSRLALGTAQFGSDYGITNRAGQVTEDEAAAILSLASQSGIDTIDTARLYGESESVLGRLLPANSDARIITKTGKITAQDPHAAAEQLRAEFAESLEVLCRPRVDALLIHEPRDLLGPYGDVLSSALEGLKLAGLTTKIGVSVYNGEEIDLILDRYPIDIVQLPFNAIDNRLIDGGQLERLERAGVEIHARSLFLQGLLLARADEIPDRFGPIRSAIEQLDAQFAGDGLTRLEGLLAVAFSRREIDRFIVGVTSTDELIAVLAAAERAATVRPIEIDLPVIDPRYLNPARWGELAQVG